jgi:L-ascorbate metabolism protein UlaG (beta-lactamase superfamily)
MDHLDMPTLHQLANPETTVVTAQGTTKLLRKMPFANVKELGGKDILILGDVTIQAVPVRHWGNRFPWNRNYRYTGYVMERKGTKIFFPGDTAYTPDFTWLADKQLDLAFMPIGAYSPDQFQRHHCTPEQAWEMFLDTGAKWLVPIHWNTFILSREPVEEPLQRLLQAAGKDQKRIVVTEQGESFTL